MGLPIRQQNWWVVNGTSITASFRAAPVEGNLLVAVGRIEPNDTLTMDSAGWTEAGASATSAVGSKIWYKRAGAAEATDVTVSTGVTAQDLGLNIIEIEGALAAGELLDVVATADSGVGSVTSQTTGTTAQTAQADTIAVAAVGIDGGIGRPGVQPWTNDFESVQDGRLGEQGGLLTAAKVLSSTQTVTTTGEWSASALAVGIVAVFKLSGPPTLDVPTPRPLIHGLRSPADNTTGSVTTGQTFAVQADHLYLVYVSIAADGLGGGLEPVTINTSHGGNVTWTLIASQIVGLGARRVHIFRAMPTADQVADQLTINTTIGGSPQASIGVWWLVNEVAGVRTTGTNGSGAIAQFQVGAADTGVFAEVTFSAATKPHNAVTGILLHGQDGSEDKHNHDNNPSPHRLLAERSTVNPVRPTSVQWFNGADDTIRWDWTADTHGIAVGIELAIPFPEVVTRSTSSTNSLSTSHVVTLPTGIVVGDRLTAVVGFGDNAGAVTWPVGWTELIEIDDGASDPGVEGSAAWRIADGTEGASITVTTAVARTSAHSALRIQGADDVEISAGAFGNDFAPDPLTITPTGGANNYLFIACATAKASTWVSAPSGYTNFNSVVSVTTTPFALAATAEKESIATLDNPGPFAIGSSRRWTAFTLAVHPAVISGESHERTISSIATSTLVDA